MINIFKSLAKPIRIRLTPGHWLSCRVLNVYQHMQGIWIYFFESCNERGRCVSLALSNADYLDSVHRKLHLMSDYHTSCWWFWYKLYKLISPSPSPKSQPQIQRVKGNSDSGLSLKSYGPHTHPITFRGSELEYMVQMEAPLKYPWVSERYPIPARGRRWSSPPCHVQGGHYQRKFLSVFLALTWSSGSSSVHVFVCPYICDFYEFFTQSLVRAVLEQS